MSKIPQGEWSAIAARYAKGESISRIAQSYGCTPPAIHYILKRNKQRAAHNPELRVNGTPDAPMTFPGEPRTPTIAGISRPAGLRGEEHGIGGLVPGEIRLPAGQPAEPPVVAQQPLGNPRAAGRASAFTAGLDSDLHGRAEAAIAAFRSSFDAALAEGSPIVRQRLRQAASDLMRVAARTTIVLDRLNAGAEREPSRVPDHLRSGQSR